MSNKVLVTGGAGFIGSHTVRELQASNEQVIVLDNLSTGFKKSLPNNVEFVEGDLGDVTLVENIIKQNNIKDIIHFGAHLLVPESVEKPFKYYGNNVVASQNLIRTSIENDVNNFIFSSTCAVYGMIDTYPVSEDMPRAPISPYGRSKCVTEWTLEDAREAVASGHIDADFNYAALRYFNVSGAREDGTLGQMTENAIHIIKVCCETILGVRDSVTVFGTDYDTHDGTCIRDYIHVVDLAQAHIDGLKYLRNGGDSGVFNCGYGNGYSVKEIIDVMKKVSGVDFKVIEGKRRAGDPPAIAADNRKIKQQFGWNPQYDDIEVIVKHALDWEKKMRGL